jgi:hypothetical protein
MGVADGVIEDEGEGEAPGTDKADLIEDIRAVLEDSQPGISRQRGRKER